VFCCYEWLHFRQQLRRLDGLLSMNPIIDTPFVELYLGLDFTDVKAKPVLKGSSANLFALRCKRKDAAVP
ncbi:hypothetical protein VSS93_28710, partial [Pseudomonas syringae pv. tagetis]